jgi:hypothetical protein
LDFSDRGAFFEADRLVDIQQNDDSDDYYFRANDPYVPESLYDPHNALVYCDSCDRIFHQKCHFSVPLLTLPRGKWHCLVCQTTIAKNANEMNRKEDSDNSKLFISPPETSAATLEAQFDLKHAFTKAKLLHTYIGQFKRSLQLQLAKYRQAKTAVDALTSTQKNRNHFLGSQELSQTLYRLFGGRNKLREMMVNLESVRLCKSDNWNNLLDFAKTVNQDFCQRVLFPFGLSCDRRREIRTPEFDEEVVSDLLPDEIVVDYHTEPKAIKQTLQNSTISVKTDVLNEDESCISLHNLACSVCRTSKATDLNDLILCDGAGCFRAYHCHCVFPNVTQKELECDDWFCPICSTVAECLMLIQTEYNGDDWEQRRIERELNNMPTDGSLKSWEAVDEVNPNAAWEFATATQMKDGVCNAATRRLLAQVTGEDPELDGTAGAMEEEDDDEDDDHFDLEVFEAQRRKEQEDTEGRSECFDDVSQTHSSQATLAETSSVEMEIGKDELQALATDNDQNSDGEGSNNLDCNEQSRRSRRLKKKLTVNSNTSADSSSDPGKLDSSNIVHGKRGRKKIDYIKLNDALFGDAFSADLDDGDEFEVKLEMRAQSDESDNADSSEEGSIVDKTTSPSSSATDMSTSSSNKLEGRSKSNYATRLNGGNKPSAIPDDMTLKTKPKSVRVSSVGRRANKVAKDSMPCRDKKAEEVRDRPGRTTSADKRRRRSSDVEKVKKHTVEKSSSIRPVSKAKQDVFVSNGGGAAVATGKRKRVNESSLSPSAKSK